jgi:hypothetical protein
MQKEESFFIPVGDRWSPYPSQLRTMVRRIIAEMEKNGTIKHKKFFFAEAEEGGKPGVKVWRIK